MYADLYMIKVNYNHNTLPIRNQLPVRAIDIGDKIPQKNELEWVVPNHYRSQHSDSIRQIGIRFPDIKTHPEIVSISSPDKKNKHDFIYDSKENIWFEPTKFSEKKSKSFFLFDESTVLTGITNAGVGILSYTTNNNSYDFAKIHFIPSSLSISDYEDMIADLYKIREDLIRDDRNIAKTIIKSNKTDMDLRKQLYKLATAIKLVNTNPHALLKMQTTMKKPQISNQFNLQMEIEQYINPGKLKYKSKSLRHEINTYENKIIKQLLEDLLLYTKTLGSKSSIVDIRLRNILNERELYFYKSNIELKKLLKSVEKLENDNAYKYEHSKLMKKTQEYEIEDSTIINLTKRLADFADDLIDLQKLHYVELNLEMNGLFNEDNEYIHYQTNQGMKGHLKYDRRDSHLTIKNYVTGEHSSPIEPLSHFGTINLISNHLPSHIRFFKAFSEASQRASIDSSRLISIRGYVRPQTNNVDAVSLLKKGKYPKYIFDFVYISSVFINNTEIHVPLDEGSLIKFLKNDLPIMINSEEQYEDNLMKLKQLEKLQFLTRKKKEIIENAEGFDELTDTINELLKLDLFTTLKSKERLPIIPTQIFLHNPYYRVAWHAVREITEEIKDSLSTVRYQEMISASKVEQIFETWILYKMIYILTNELGWELKNYKDIVAYLDQYLINNKKELKKFSVTLYWQEWTLELYYEPKINIGSKYLLPDFVFKFKKGNVYTGMVILDAKYRNYMTQGEAFWVKDIKNVAMEKYGNLESTVEEWNYPIISSSIIHSDMSISKNTEDKYNPYHVMYNEDLFDTRLSKETAHKYSSICLTPSETYTFKNWFRMIMEYHLDEYEVCWNCGETGEIHKRQLLTKKGYVKYYYTCKSCKEFWIKVHCRLNHHKIIKHLNNYHLQVEDRNQWWTVCPACGDGKPTT